MSLTIKDIQAQVTMTSATVRQTVLSDHDNNELEVQQREERLIEARSE